MGTMAVDRFFSPTTGRPLAIGPSYRAAGHGVRPASAAAEPAVARPGAVRQGRAAPMRPSVKIGEYDTVDPVNGA